jgi:putative transposase
VCCAWACRLAQFSRASWEREGRAKDQSALRFRLRDLAHARSRFGYQWLWVLWRRGGWPVNRKRVRRVYRLDGLQLCMRVRRRKPMTLHRGPASVPVGPQERGSMDFMPDTLADGRPFRIFTVGNNGSRSSPGGKAGLRMSGRRSVRGSIACWAKARARGPSPSLRGLNSKRGRSKIGPTDAAGNSIVSVLPDPREMP